jgi:hypothetical protein
MRESNPSRRLAALACAGMLLLATWAGAQIQFAGTVSDPAATLRARFAGLKGELASNMFRRPLHMESREGANDVMGEIYAHVDFPFSAAGAALEKPSQWCDVLILHLNTKYCIPEGKAPGTYLHVHIGKKYDQLKDDAYLLSFAYHLTARSANYLQVKLSAPDGPLSTRDYRIDLEATPADDGGTYIRLSYSYGFGIMSKLAMQAYLASVGRNKVGFTVTGKESDGSPRYIGGTRGVVERNTMRYYLAIEAYLGSQSLPPPARLEKSLRDWFAATENYPLQLREMPEREYLEMKRLEYARQQADFSARSRETS